MNEQWPNKESPKTPQEKHAGWLKKTLVSIGIGVTMGVAAELLGSEIASSLGIHSDLEFQKFMAGALAATFSVTIGQNYDKLFKKKGK